MASEPGKGYPVPSVRRMPQYLRVLREFAARGRDAVSCTHIAKALQLGAVQVRKDLALTGIVGRPKVGYEIAALIDAIERFLGWKKTHNALLVGVGSLGRALLGYEGLREAGLNIVAGFDVDPAKIGTQVHGREVFPLDKLDDVNRGCHAPIGILTVPVEAAQQVAALLVQAGVQAVWNYTPAKLDAPASIVVEDVRLTASLAVLSSRLAQREEESEEG